MGAKGQKHFGEQGQKKIKKKPDRSKGGGGSSGGRGEEGGKEEGVKRKRLDAMTVGYFRRVSERLSEGFADDEEQGKGENLGKAYVLTYRKKCFWIRFFFLLYLIPDLA